MRLFAVAPRLAQELQIMSKALTPSQLKAELDTQKDALLKACLYALNEILTAV
uniref:hypothetical protein n=1 Tax=Klebsiella pneumoniae TaxID=573 RepID=UPI0022BA5222|nr:hypothetical protein [Klebsiella pneumoniae]VXR48187.1 Uncharacterised protein [Klebsiella pneumoniae]VXZ93116.1 Uncharacterised protein [Klebsiella pneumoniae]